MEVKYRYTRAELAGNPLALWVARLLRVKPKLVKMELTPSEAEKLGLTTNEKPKVELPLPGLNNGYGE
jgi:hypothetical protein